MRILKNKKFLFSLLFILNVNLLIANTISFNFSKFQKSGNNLKNSDFILSGKYKYSSYSMQGSLDMKYDNRAYGSNDLTEFAGSCSYTIVPDGTNTKTFELVDFNASLVSGPPASMVAFFELEGIKASDNSIVKSDNKLNPGFSVYDKTTLGFSKFSGVPLKSLEFKFVGNFVPCGAVGINSFSVKKNPSNNGGNHSIKVGDKTSKVSSKVNGSKTINTSDGGIKTTASVKNINIEAITTAQGQSTAKISLNGKTSSISSKIVGSVTSIDENGNTSLEVEPIVYTDSNGCTIIANISTDTNGETQTTFKKVCSGKETLLDATVANDGKFEIGNSVEIYEENADMYMQIDTKVTREIEF